MDLTEIVKNFDFETGDIETLKVKAEKGFDKYGIYPGSINRVGNAFVMMMRTDTEKKLVCLGDDDRLAGLDGTIVPLENCSAKVCSITNYNCRIIREIFPFMSPVVHKGKKVTIGLGDRLGLASPGHIRTVTDLDVFPVLAQQSIRELNLTGRTYDDVISAAAWAVFQQGYKKGYGADGDHLKTAEEVKMALDIGMTMITLDCSDHIDNDAANENARELAAKYNKLPEESRKNWEKKYSNMEINFDGFKYRITDEDIVRAACVYGNAINHTLDIYHNLIAKCGRPIDFEMSIDETLTSTTPFSHYFVASELCGAGVDITSLAPRFCGEFQKGIDYRGDSGQFTDEFSVHAAIADHFGYKISVHSGSDKFLVFPVIGEKTAGNFHIKTAGTNWLEAVRVTARYNPGLYRRMHAYALEHLDEAKKYYHISAKTENIPQLDSLSDSELETLMDKDDSRQLMHITYGLLLQAKDGNGKTLFKDELYQFLYRREDEYDAALIKHIGRHLKALGL